MALDHWCVADQRESLLSSIDLLSQVSKCADMSEPNSRNSSTIDQKQQQSNRRTFSSFPGGQQIPEIVMTLISQSVSHCQHSSKTLYEETQFEWQFSNFFLLSETEILNSSFKSEYFFFGKSWWILKIQQRNSDSTWLHIENIGKHCEKDVEYEVGMKKTDGSVEQLRTGRSDFEVLVHQAIYPISRVKLLRQNLAPPNGLTIKCTLKRGTGRKPTINLLQEESLRQDYKKVFLEGQNHDLILKVEDKEFPVHRDILRVRSRVFESMLRHDMEEKNSGVIDISDCDSRAIEQLLLYVYCGKVETLDESNVSGLYYAADKYDIAALKEECKNFIKKSLSSTNVCEVIQLALNHNDSSLLEYATEYFCSNSHNILRTLEWQSFFKDNFTVANELLIKSIDALRNVKKVRLE